MLETMTGRTPDHWYTQQLVRCLLGREREREREREGGRERGGREGERKGGKESERERKREYAICKTQTRPNVCKEILYL